MKWGPMESPVVPLGTVGWEGHVGLRSVEWDEVGSNGKSCCPIRICRMTHWIE